MKTIFLSVILIALLACQVETNIEASNPSLTKINGQWQLSKTSIGYPMPDGPNEIKVVDTEIISFNASKKTFTRTINGKVTETTTFDVKKVSNNGSEEREAVVFEKEKKYAYLTFDDANAAIILYETVPIGAELADGNSYHYQKVK